MTDLSSLQAWFSASIREEGFPRAVELNIEGGRGLDASERLAIYREQYFLRHEGSLEEDFRGLARVLSAEEFSHLARGFLDFSPPRDYSLSTLGRRFPDFVRRETLERGTLLAELSELDLAFTEAFIADDAPKLDLATLAQLGASEWETARVEFHPSLRLFEFDFPVHEFRRALLASDGEVSSPEPRRTFLIVYRRSDFSLYDKELPEAGYRILAQLIRGTSLLEACESVASGSEEFTREIGENLQDWFRDFASLGLFSRVVTEGGGSGA